MLQDFDAELHDWRVIPVKLGIVIVGRVKGDRKGGFADGRSIHTSLVLTRQEDIQEGVVIWTMNTRYLLARSATTH